MDLAHAFADIHNKRHKVSVEVMFYRGSNGPIFWDRLICWWTSGPYSHVEFRFNQQLCYSATLRDKQNGTRFKLIDVTPEHWDIFSLDLGALRTKCLLTWCQQQTGCRYDLVGALGLGIGRKGDNPTKRYCSEVVARGLEHIEFQSFPERVSPNELYRLRNSKWLPQVADTELT